MNYKSNISDSTKKIYLKCLESLKEMKIDINNIENSENIITVLKNKELSLNTIKTYLSALLWYSRTNNVNIEYYDKISNVIIKICEEKNIQAKTNKLTSKEKENFITWKQVEDVYGKIKKVYESNKNNKSIEELFVILSLYIWMPARRILDYTNMYINNKIDIQKDKIISYNFIDYIVDIDDNLELEEENAKKNTSNDKIIDKKNYYVRIENKGYFVFNNYKTKKSYSSQILEINPILDTILQNYIKGNKLRNRQKLFKISHTNFIMKIKKIFSTYVNKNISASMLRHIYITYARDNDLLKNENDKNQLAKQMGHSKLTQDDYYKKIKDEKIDIQINKNADIDIIVKPGRKNVYTDQESKQKAMNDNKKRWYEKNKEKVAQQRKNKRNKHQE